MPLPSQPWLSLITDDSLATTVLETTVARACAQARLVVQLRAKSLAGAELLESARRLGEITRPSGSLCIVNDRLDVALAAGADGAHLPAAGMASAAARRLLGPQRLLGRSVHTLEEIERERTLAAVDYLQFGPVFATRSKAAFGAPQGIQRLAEAVDRARPLPLVAVGGIDRSNVGEVVASGAAAAAVIAAIMHARDAARATRELWLAMQRHADALQ